MGGVVGVWKENLVEFNMALVTCLVHTCSVSSRTLVLGESEKTGPLTVATPTVSVDKLWGVGGR